MEVALPKSAEGKTDREALEVMPDAAISFTADAAQTTAEDWADAVAHRGLPLPSRKEQIALRVDADVLQWFRAQGTGWQTRMNAVLRSCRDALGAQVPQNTKPGTSPGKAANR